MRDHALHRLQQIRAALGPLVDGYASLEDAVRGLVEDRGRLCAELAEARAEFAAIDEALGLGGEGRTRWQGQRVAEIRDWIERWRRSHVEARDLHEQLAAIECVRCGESAEPESSEALRPSGMCGQCERAAAVRPDPLERIAAAAETIARVARGVRP
ncbi:MAG TPA: hypothetical protein VD931_09390 [Baekduia sp.]|nr:hypothetical protein [Baekduia sp.]